MTVVRLPYPRDSDGPERAPLREVQAELLARFPRRRVARVLPALDPAARQLPLAPVAVGMADEDHGVAIADHAFDPARLRPRDAPVHAQPCMRDAVAHAAHRHRQRADRHTTRVRSAAAGHAARRRQPSPSSASRSSSSSPPAASARESSRCATTSPRSRDDPRLPPPVGAVADGQLDADGALHELEVGAQLRDGHRRHLAADLGLGHRRGDGPEGGDADGQPDWRVVVHGAMATRKHRRRNDERLGHPLPLHGQRTGRSPPNAPASPPCLSHRRVIPDVRHR